MSAGRPLHRREEGTQLNVVFFGGADFDPPPPLGGTGRDRYVKVRTLEEAEAPELHQWIEKAGRVPGWK